MRTWQPLIGRHALLDTPLELRYGKFYNIISDCAQIMATSANLSLIESLEAEKLINGCCKVNITVSSSKNMILEAKTMPYKARLA